MKALLVAILALVFSVGVFAQGEGRQGTTAPILGGILNGRAIDLPQPEYPEAAMSARLGGVVGVNVLVDETGAVVSARAEVLDQRTVRNAEGTKAEPREIDPSLREAAEAAARRARFNPASLGGQPVKMRGKLLYNFAVDHSDRGPRVADIFGPMINGEAVSLPLPAYPEAARAARAQGGVTVRVEIDEQGRVISATAVNGHPLLHQAAEEAARKATFHPSLVQGKPSNRGAFLHYEFAVH